jgi:hypothetical protein
MKKTFLFLALFIFGFSFSKAQDTLAFKNNGRVAVKVISIKRNKVFFQTHLSDKLLSVSLSELKYIQYGNGARYTIEKKDKGINKDSTDYWQFALNGGIGWSFMAWGISGKGYSFGSTPEVRILSETLAYNFTTDINLKGILSFGAGLTYQSLTDDPKNERVVITETEKISRWNISGRFLGHFSSSLKNDAYVGVRLGISSWTDQILSYTATSVNSFPVQTMPAENETLSYQLLIGFRRFVTDNIGVQAEAGVGSPYILEGGLTLRL